MIVTEQNPPIEAAFPIGTDRRIWSAHLPYRFPQGAGTNIRSIA